MNIELFIYMPRHACKLISFLSYVLVRPMGHSDRFIITVTKCKHNAKHLSLKTPRSRVKSEIDLLRGGPLEYPGSKIPW
jgi:hypothetical protein